MSEVVDQWYQYIDNQEATHDWSYQMYTNVSFYGIQVVCGELNLRSMASLRIYTV